MADEAGTTEATQEAAADTAAATQEQATTETKEAKEVDPKAEAEKWKALARKHEATAKANADKAKRFEEFEESQKTEMQKATERAEAAERKAAEVEARANRAEVAAAKGVPADLLSGTTVEELEASADKLLEFAKSRKAASTSSGGDFTGGTGEQRKAPTTLTGALDKHYGA